MLNKEMRFDPLGDGISCLELIDFMGTDQSIVKAARVSTGRDNIEPNLERDSKLIRFMMTHNHGTPFEHTSVTFHVALPIFVARQWIRHRIGVSFNEVSRRYTSDDIQFYYPKLWRAQDTKNKQGSIDGVSDELNHHADRNCREVCVHALSVYERMVEEGIGKEMARIVLPTNLYTRWYFTANVRSLMLFHTLRADSHAQFEIRVYADAISEIMKELFPITWSIYLEETNKNKA